MASSANPIPEPLAAALDQVSADRLMEYTSRIAQWVRLSGTPEERAAFDYIDETLRGFGLTTQRYEPVCLVSLPVSASLALLDTGDQPYCITHSFSISTGPEGIEGEVVYVGHGTDADYAGKDVRGKIALAEGLATPNKVGPAERHGVAGMIHISGPQIHEMIVSPVWGSPTPDTAPLLPSVPHVSVDSATGEDLKRRLAQGIVRVRLRTEVDTGWRTLPVLIASIPPARPFDETFVLLSGHVDSWHYGAMDNGSANASMIECARLLAERRDDLRREVRLAFWSGHSHARYATSAWFADEFWTELHERCVAHVNIDSPGGVGATVLTEAPTMAETYDLARALIAHLADQDLEYRRIGRMGDQSFWGVGVPSLYCSISEQALAPDATDISAALTGSKARSGGLGWWWHTPDDTIDKIDPANLRRDARVLLATVYRLATDRVLPFAPSRAVDEIRQALGEIASAAGDAFDLAPALADVDALLDAARRLEERLGRPLDDEQARAANRAVMEVSHWLIPVNYTRTGQFDHDLALGERSLPGLRPAERLRDLPAADRHLLETRLRRERNRLRFALRQARARVERTLATLG